MTIETDEDAKHQETTEPGKKSPSVCSYIDCLMGRAEVPSTKPDFTAFQLVMVASMIFVNTTISGLAHSGLDFLRLSHWMYPVTFCIAFFIRVTIANKITGPIMKNAVNPRFGRFVRNIAASVVNVSVMATIICAATTLLTIGIDGFVQSFLASLPATLTVGILVHFFFVGPLVKMAYCRSTKPLYGLRVFRVAHRYAIPGTVIFGS